MKPLSHHRLCVAFAAVAVSSVTGCLLVTVIDGDSNAKLSGASLRWFSGSQPRPLGDHGNGSYIQCEDAYPLTGQGTIPAQPAPGVYQFAVDKAGYVPLRAQIPVGYAPIDPLTTPTCNGDVTAKAIALKLYESPAGFDPGWNRLCLRMADGVWDHTPFCPTGGFPDWFVFVNSEFHDSSTGVTHSCPLPYGPSSFGKVFKPYMRVNGAVVPDSIGQNSSPLRLDYTHKPDGSYKVNLGFDFIIAGEPVHGESPGPQISHPCCSSAQECLNEGHIAYVGISAGRSAAFPQPPLSQLHVKVDMRETGKFRGNPQYPGNTNAASFITIQPVYASQPGDVMPSCGGMAACVYGASTPPGCKWCDPGTTVARNMQLTFDPWADMYEIAPGGCAPPGLCDPNGNNAAYHSSAKVMGGVRTRFDSEIIFLHANRAPQAYPGLTETVQHYDIDMGALWAYSKTIQIFNPFGCGGPAYAPWNGTGYSGSCTNQSVCARSCTSSCTNGGCYQRMFSEAPDAATLTDYNVQFGIESNRSATLYVEYDNWRMSN